MIEKVDVSKLREGDVVTVRGEFVSLCDGGKTAQLSAGKCDVFFLPCEFIVSVEPRALKVGDFVTRNEGGRVWTIKAIDAGAALLAAGRDLDAEYLANLSEAFP